MTHQQVVYHIPVEIFLLVNFPSTAPQVYVKPTSDMQIAPQHRNVARDGLVYMQYLSGWMSNHNLNDLCSQLSRMFSASPPVFAKQQSQPQPKPVIVQPPTYSNVGNGSYNNNSRNNSYSYPTSNSYSSISNANPYNPQNNQQYQQNLQTSNYNYTPSSSSLGVGNRGTSNASTYNTNTTTTTTDTFRTEQREREKKEECKRRIKNNLDTHIKHLFGRIKREVEDELLKQVKLKNYLRVI